MDYPKSVPGVGLVNGRFVDEDATAGRPGSLIPSEWGNAVTDELLAVVRGADLEPDEADSGQVLEAIEKLLAEALKDRPLAYSISELPDEDVGPIIVQECSEVWIWTETPYFTGYRSPLCGRPVDGHTLTPLASEVDAVGGVLPKAAYARLWGYAQENGLVVTQTFWNANKGGHYFVDIDANTFRVPDLRDMFRRFTGTDADTANARALGSKQGGAIQSHRHPLYGYLMVANGTGGGLFGLNTGSGSTTSTSYIGDAGGAETRPVNAAYFPRVHA